MFFRLFSVVLLLLVGREDLHSVILEKGGAAASRALVSGTKGLGLGREIHRVVQGSNRNGSVEG